MVWAVGNNPANHLNLGRQLQRLVATQCNCPAGSRVNAWCAHVTAMVMVLVAPSVYRPPTKFSARLADPNLPDLQQPTMSGPHAMAAASPEEAVTPPVLPPRVSRDTRANTRGQLLVDFGSAQPTIPSPLVFRAGFAPHLVPPNTRQPAVLPGTVDRGRRGAGRLGRGRQVLTQRQVQVAHPSGLGHIINFGELN